MLFGGSGSLTPLLLPPCRARAPSSGVVSGRRSCSGEPDGVTVDLAASAGPTGRLLYRQLAAPCGYEVHSKALAEVGGSVALGDEPDSLVEVQGMPIPDD